jgi:cytochrome P450
VPFAVAPGLQELTLDLIIELVFGVRDEERRRRMHQVLPALARASTPVLFFPWLGRDLGPRSIGGRFSRLRAQARALVQEQIDEHRRGAEGDEQDILTLLMAARDEAGRPLTDAELRDELFTLLFAGHETTATALSWAVDLMSHDDAAGERLVAAAREDDDAYLDAFITEVHRVRPTVPNVVRRLREPLELDPWRLPAGVIVAPAIWLTHRRPELYPEPEAFRPERWLGKRPGTSTWLPFGGGIRRCIGASFAQLEMREVLRVMFRRCTLEPASARPEDHKRRTVTNVPRRGARVLVTRREAARGAVAA